MDIIVAAGSLLPNPPVGSVTLFINSEDNNILSYKDNSGRVWRYNGNDDGDPSGEVGKGFAYKIAKKMVDGMAEGLENGTLDPADYQTFISNGLNVKVKETDSGNGTKTYDINIGPRNMTESY